MSSCTRHVGIKRVPQIDQVGKHLWPENLLQIPIIPRISKAKLLLRAKLVEKGTCLSAYRPCPCHPRTHIPQSEIQRWPDCATRATRIRSCETKQFVLVSGSLQATDKATACKSQISSNFILHIP